MDCLNGEDEQGYPECKKFREPLEFEPGSNPYHPAGPVVLPQPDDTVNEPIVNVSQNISDSGVPDEVFQTTESTSLETTLAPIVSNFQNT